MGGCFRASLTQLNHTHTWFTNRHTHIMRVLTSVPRCSPSALNPQHPHTPASRLPTACRTCSTAVCAASPPSPPASSSSCSCPAPLTVARCLPTATQLFISRPPDRRWCNCSLHWSMKTERKGKSRERQSKTVCVVKSERGLGLCDGKVWVERKDMRAPTL